MRHFILTVLAGCMTLLSSAQMSGNHSNITTAPVTFTGNTSTLTPESDKALNEIKDWLISKTYISTLRIEGHAFGFSNNQFLSEQRALAVCKWLVAHGIDCKRLLPVGFGNTKPVVSEGNAANTRIVAVNAALRDHPIGGMPVDGGGKPAGDPCRQ